MIDFSNMTQSEVMKYFEEKYGFKYADFLKTKDAKVIQKNIIKIFQKFFSTDYGKNKFYLFMPTNSTDEIKRRFEIIENSLKISYDEVDFSKFFNLTLKDVSVYDVCFVTNDYKNYESLITKYKHYPIFYVETPQDLEVVKGYSQVRTDSEEIAQMLPNAILTDIPFPEVEVKKLLAVLNELNEIKDYLSEDLKDVIDDLNNFKEKNIYFEQWFATKLNEINQNIAKEIKQLQFTGEDVIKLINEGKNEKLISLLENSLTFIENEIKKEFNVSVSLINFIDLKYPLEIEQKHLDELSKYVKSEILYQEFYRYKTLQEKINTAEDFLNKVKIELGEIDFKVGIKRIIKYFDLKKPRFISKGFKFKDGKNIFLINKRINKRIIIEPVEYDVLDKNLILLTGANSGGKTTLLQLIAQIYILAKSGFYVPAKAELQLVNELYYFSKPTGKTDAGAFETLLKTFAKINSTQSKLILADEIEAITEPGAAAKILIGILEWFKDKNAIVIIVTHLGNEIKEHITEGIRFDGIQAIGIENGKLIVNRSPIKNIIARSTPELIVEKLKTHGKFFEFIWKILKQNN